MKRKLTGLTAVFLLVFSTCLTAQRPRVVKNMAPAATNRVNPRISQRPNSCTVDTIILTTQDQIDNFATNFPACTTPNYLFIDGTGASPAITNLNGLSTLSEITHKLKISHTSLTSITALNNLVLIGDTLELEHNPLITEIGLYNLDSLGAIVFKDLPLLTNMAGLCNNITTIGSINIDSTALTSLDGLNPIVNITTGGFYGLRIAHTPITNLSSLENLSTLQGYFILEDNPELTDIGITTLTQAYGFLFSNLPNLTSLAGLSNQLTNTGIGTFWMINTGLTNLSGLDSLTSAANFYIILNPGLTSLHGLEKLSGDIGGGISVNWNNVLTDISALGNISSISDANLEISNNDLLASLAGVGHITSIGRGLWINDNNSLTTLGDFNDTLVIQNTDNSDSVRINNNSQLALCSFTPLCVYLNTDGRAEINNNAPGCSSISEIAASCGIVCLAGAEKTWNGVVSNDWNDADNWTPAGVPGTCTKVTIPSSGDVPNYPIATSPVFIGGLIMESGAELGMDGFDLDITKALHLQDAFIYSAHSITATRITEPYLHDSNLDGPFSCIDYSGLSEFLHNTFFGNTVLSDSTGRQAQSGIFFNTFHGDLTIVCNSDYGQMYLSNASPNYDYVEGDLTVDNNSTASISVGLGGGNPLQLNGNFIVHSNAGGVDINNLTFTGNNQAHITQTGTVPITIENLWMNKFGGGGLVLDQDVKITNSLNFTYNNNIIYSTPDKLLVMGDGTAAWTVNGSFVSGPVKKIGAEGFTFPIGLYDNSGRWFAPLTITPPAAITDEFTAQYFHHNPGNDGYDTSLYTPGFGGLSGKEYWNLTRNAGTSAVNVTLSYDSARSGVAYLYNDMQVAGWNGSLWNSWGNGGFTGNMASGQVVSDNPLTAYGPLSLSFKPVRKPVISIGTVDSIPCSGFYFKVPVNLDTAMIAGNIFKVEVSDSLGVFNPAVFIDVLGTKATITSDTILAYMPFVMNYGSHYKLRVIGSLPRDTSVNQVIVIPSTSPQQTFNITGPSPACIGNGIQKYYPSIHEANTIYTWTLSGGGTFTVSGDTALVTWATPGTYNLTLKSSNHCGNGPQKIQSIVVNPPAPVATPVINNTGRWLYGSQVPLSANYQWYRNGTLIVGAVNATYYATLAGDYTLKFINSCGNGPVSNTISFASASLPQTITFPTMAGKAYGDAPFVPVATASSGLPVSFNIISGPASINAQTNTLTITGTGLVTVNAFQPGDHIYDTAAFVTRSFTVSKAAQVISFATIADQNFTNTSTSLSAITTSGLPVTFTIVSGPASIAGGQLTFTGLGTVVVRASQTGDTNYLPATAVNRSFCIYVSSLNPISGFSNLCPATAAYSVNNIPNATYFWRIAGGATLPSVTNTVNINWTTPGTYSLLVSASGPCGPASSTDTLAVTVINSVLPDSVQSMYPADGAVNQQLPLTLSWVPAVPNAFYTFDVYIWRSDLPQPAVPYAADLTAVNYTIPLNSGLAFNQTYKWMVVSHNGSCININTGPIQQFSLIPLPDLVVQNVLAPTTAFSGQTISINWTVRNPGPGKTNTSQHWTDGVFLTFDSLPNFQLSPQTDPAAWGQLDYPSRPLLIATKPNVSALDSGQQYSNSVNFTLPVSYSLPLYAYVITNYPSNANAPFQVTKANDTARAPQPIAVTLSPTPDLRVDTVFTPGTTFSGSTISLTYKVKNYGVLTPAASVWTDKIYISSSPLFNINSALLLKTPKANGSYYSNAADAVVHNSGQLLADSVYTRSLQVVVPNFIFGTYFIYVLTNAGDTLYEGALNNNNINRSQLQVFLTPTPHLTVSSLTAPGSTASTTQPFGVNWNINNTGFNDNVEKNKGHYFRANGTCTIPGAGISGVLVTDSMGFGSSYWVDRVYLSTDAGGLDVSNAVMVNETAQGQAGTGFGVPDTLVDLGCQPLGTDPAQLNFNTNNVIKLSSNHPKSASFNIPSGLPAGNYYIYVLTNASRTVYEYPGTPETRRSALPITIQRPDATVSALTVPPTAVGGQSLAINYSILNNGPGTVFNHLRRDKIYVSTSPVFNGSAQLIDSVVYTEDLPVGTAIPHTRNYTFPVSVSGTRYFYVHTNYDSAFREINAANNISAAASINVTAAAANDLVVSNIQLADTVFSVYPMYVKYTVVNNGNGSTSGAWTDSVFISCAPVFNRTTSYYIAKRSHSGIVAGGSGYVDSFNVSYPFAYEINNCFPKANINTAYFYIKTNADSLVYEGGSASNNVTGSGSRVLINPSVDLVVTTVSGPDTATVARPYPVNWTVKNNGYNPGLGNYNFWYDAVYFSPDSVFNNNAVIASGFLENSPVNTGLVYSDAKNAIPPNLPTGDYYVFARANFNPPYGIAHEVVLSNNDNVIRNGAGAAKKIHLVQPLLPDLTDSILTAPAIAAVGQPITIIHRVSNNGAGITYPSNWSMDCWLSPDFIPGNSGDIVLSGKNHVGALLPGQSYLDTITVTFPLNQAPGNYIVISRVNSTGNLIESNGTNNLAFSYLTIYSPAPSDLIVESVSKPDTVFLGYTLDSAKWVIRNISANTASGVSADGVYLSASGILDSTAVLVGIKNKTINMAPLGRDTISLQPLITNVTEGDYRVIVKTDLLNNIVESNKNNNTGIASALLYVRVKELPLNVLTPNTLQATSRFYKLVIPDSLNGATIRVVLKSTDSLTMKNQLYIGKGYIPSAANFDYAYNTPNYGNQDIVMSNVTAGVYYITVKCVSINPVLQNITLEATRLPFAILTVQSASGGNTGNVTVRMNGSLFVNNMTATLSKPGTTIQSAAVYFINSTTVFVTFNLQGKPLGVYDVSLTRPDTTTATLHNGFSVVTANNGGLITGGGVNTGSGNGNAPGCDPGAASGLNSQLVTEIVAPDKVLVGWPFVIQINYSNPTNVDIPAQARTLYSDHDVLMSLTPAGVASGTTSLYLELTEQNGPPGIIRAGGSGSIIVYSKMQASLPRNTLVLFNLK